jgi:hypothetical protein
LPVLSITAILMPRISAKSRIVSGGLGVKVRVGWDVGVIVGDGVTVKGITEDVDFGKGNSVVFMPQAERANSAEDRPANLRNSRRDQVFFMISSIYQGAWQHC